MGLGEMTEMQQGEIKTMVTLDEHEFDGLYSDVCSRMYRQRQLRERIYRELDLEIEVEGGAPAAETETEVQWPGRNDFSRLSRAEKIAELDRMSEKLDELSLDNLKLLSEIKPATSAAVASR